MPSIIVKTAATPGREGAVMLQERIASDDLLSGHFSAQLIERVAWAVLDAERAEYAARVVEPSAPQWHRSAA